MRWRWKIGLTVIISVTIFSFIGSFRPNDQGAIIQRDSYANVHYIHKDYNIPDYYTIINEDEESESDVEVAFYEYYKNTKYKGYSFGIYYHKDLFRRCYKGSVNGKYRCLFLQG